MRIPHVNPIGIVELPDGYLRTPRRYSSRFRALAGVTVVGFAFVGVVTTVWTLATYCLTSHAGMPLTLP